MKQQELALVARQDMPTASLPPKWIPRTQEGLAAKDDLTASSKLAASAADLVRQLPSAEAVVDCLAAALAGDLDGAGLEGPEGLLLPLFAPGARTRPAAAGPRAAAGRRGSAARRRCGFCPCMSVPE